MDAIESLEDLKKSRLLAQINKGFDWCASLPAPFGAEGWFVFRLPHPDIFRSTDRTVPRDTAVLFQKFAATFCVLAPGTDITPYTTTLTRLLMEDGVGEEAGYYPRMALPLIVRGLSDYASVLGPYLHLLGDDPVAIPISLMHIWALGEAARMHLTCICAGGNWADTAEDAEEVLRVTQAENLAIHASETPYSNIFLNDYAAAIKEEMPRVAASRQ